MSARGNKNSQFKRGSGAFVCANCKKRTRDTGQGEGNLRFCKDCIRQMEEENARADGKPSKQLIVPILPQLPSVERELQFDEWSATMRDLFQFENKMDGARVKYQLIVGRAFAYGQERWKRGAEHEATRIGFALGTLYNWSSVARRISPSIERDYLTFEDYRALAKLENDAEREKYIALKQANNWSGKRLDAEISNFRLNATSERALASHSTASGSTPHIAARDQSEDDAPDSDPDDVLELKSPVTASTSRANASKLFILLNEWEHAAARLQARGDEMSRAQADVYFDCVDALRDSIGG